MIHSFAMLLFLALAAGPNGSTHCHGTVTGPTGTPIAGAHVYFEDEARFTDPATFETDTNAKGEFALSVNFAPEDARILLVAQAEGFKPAQLAVPAHENTIAEIHLARTSSKLNSVIRLKPRKK